MANKPELCPNLYVNMYGEFCFDKTAYAGYNLRRIISGIKNETPSERIFNLSCLIYLKFQ